MYQLKTQQNNDDVLEYIQTLWDEQKISDCLELIDTLSEVTAEPAKMWWTSIIWFGTYHYKYDSGHEGDMCLIGFAPRKSNITLYTNIELSRYEDIIKDIGKYKVSGKSCVQIKKLSDINIPILKKLIQRSVEDMKKKYPNI